MYTIVVYWSKDRFTKYEHVDALGFTFGTVYLSIRIDEKCMLRIPYTSINRVETIEEDS